MTDKPITQADLDAFRAEIVEALRAMFGSAYSPTNVAAADFLKIADRLATPPKPRPELPGMETWERLSKENDEMMDWTWLTNLAASIVAGDVELPRYKEGR